MPKGLRKSFQMLRRGVRKVLAPTFPPTLDAPVPVAEPNIFLSGLSPAQAPDGTPLARTPEGQPVFPAPGYYLNPSGALATAEPPRPVSTWSTRHPRLSAALEGALLGAAYAPSGNTFGENIAGIARTVLSLPLYKQQLEMSRMAPTLEYTKFASDLATAEAQRKMLRAHSDYYSAYAGALRTPQPATRPPEYSHYFTAKDGNLYGVTREGEAQPILGPQGTPLQAPAPDRTGSFNEELYRARFGVPPGTPIDQKTADAMLDFKQQQALALAGAMGRAAQQRGELTEGVQADLARAKGYFENRKIPNFAAASAAAIKGIIPDVLDWQAYNETQERLHNAYQVHVRQQALQNKPYLRSDQFVAEYERGNPLVRNFVDLTAPDLSRLGLGNSSNLPLPQGPQQQPGSRPGMFADPMKIFDALNEPE